LPTVRDGSLLDALELHKPVVYSGPVWRTVRSGRDPLRSSRSGGRWDDGTFDVLYASETQEGAAAEIRYHLRKGQPIVPSKVTYEMFELFFRLNKCLRLVNLEALSEIGVDTSRYGAASYAELHQSEYPRTQEIGESAYFLGFDGLCVPNARYDCQNIVLFDDVIEQDGKAVINNHGLLKI